MRKNEPSIHAYLHDYFRAFLPDLLHVSSKTIRSYKESIQQYRLWLRDFREVSFSELSFENFDAETISAFLNHLSTQKHLKASTINLRMAALKSFLRYSGERDISLQLLYEKAKTIKPFKDKCRKEEGLRYLTPEQVEILAAQPDLTTRLGRRDRFLIILSYASGARRQELVDMTVGDLFMVDDQVTLRMHGKGQKTRWVPILEDTVPHVNSYLREFHTDMHKSAPLLYTVHNGERAAMCPATINAILKRHAVHAHASDESFPSSIHPHMLRHSIAMSMYKRGVPISYIRDFLGHASVDTTSIYSRADAETIRKALEECSVLAASNASYEQPEWRDLEAELLTYTALG